MTDEHEALTAVDTRARLDLIAALGCGFLESGHTASQTERRLGDVARACGIDELGFNAFGRLISLEAPLPDGHTVSLSRAAKSLDAIDYTRSRALNQIAVSWLLLIPLPQVIGAVTDALDADFMSAVSRLGSVAMAAVGIAIGGAVTFGLGEVLGMDHPRLDSLPEFPWYLVLVFSALGAIGNAFANGGRTPLILPAAGIGMVTAAANQVLLNAAALTPLWANSLSAVVLGVLTVIIAKRTGDPQPVLALVGITGALLPGIPVFFGILQEMGFGSGGQYFLRAAITCAAIGVGVAFSSYLASIAGNVREQRRHASR